MEFHKHSSFFISLSSATAFHAFFFTLFFFNQDFPSGTLTTYRTAEEARGPFFITLYHFHSLTNIQAFICNFAYDYRIFLIASLPNCYSMRSTTLSNYYLIDWWCEVSFCLITWWFDTSFFYSNLDTGNWWTRLSTLYYKRTD